MKAPDKCRHLSVPSVFLPLSSAYSDGELAQMPLSSTYSDAAGCSSYVSDSLSHTVALTDQLHSCMKYCGETLMGAIYPTLPFASANLLQRYHADRIYWDIYF